MSKRWTNKVYLGDNLKVIMDLPSGSVDLIYIDPPFNTGRVQKREQIKVQKSSTGLRNGFAGKRYDSEVVGTESWNDQHEDYYSFLEPRLVEAHRLLADTGTLYFHIDYREVHYCKLLLDRIFGKDCFLNEIIWAYDYGARPKNRWPPKHDNILVYVKHPTKYCFYPDQIDREAYMAPGLVGPEKAERGKLPTNVWWHTIVSPTGKEKTGWPTQKPLGVLRRLIRGSSKKNDLVLDFFAGSGTTAVACAELERRFILVEQSPRCMEIIQKRLESFRIAVDYINRDAEMTHSPTRKNASKKHNPGNASPKSSGNSIHAILVGCANYDNLGNLNGIDIDLENMRKLLSEEGDVGVIPEANIQSVVDPTAEDFRLALYSFMSRRSAAGDTLLLYFSGHGAALSGYDFGFCVKDTRQISGIGIDPLSIIELKTVLRAIDACKAHLILIIDACFSGSAKPKSDSMINLTVQMGSQAQIFLGESYSVVLATGEDDFATATNKGSELTRSLTYAALNAKHGKDLEFLSLSELLESASKYYADKFGMKLYYCGNCPASSKYLFRNKSFQKTPRYRFSPYMLEIVHYVMKESKWVSLNEIKNKFQEKAYCNYTKLCRPPWDLLQKKKEGQHPSVKITDKGKLFVQGKIKIPRTIERIPGTKDAYRESQGSDFVSANEVIMSIKNQKTNR